MFIITIQIEDKYIIEENRVEGGLNDLESIGDKVVEW